MEHFISKSLFQFTKGKICYLTHEQKVKEFSQIINDYSLDSDILCIDIFCFEIQIKLVSRRRSKNNKNIVTSNLQALQLTFNSFSELVKGLMFFDNFPSVVVSFAEWNSDIIILTSNEIELKSN